MEAAQKWQREGESEEQTSSLEGSQVENDSNNANTPSGSWKSGAFCLNTFDFASLQTSF